MAGAPIKQGLDFYPSAVGLLKDRKFRRMKMKYGSVALVIYLGLLDMIYSEKGYYLEYESNKDEVIWELLEILQGRFQPDADTVSDVIDGLAESGLFSGGCYPKIITSKRIQATYYKATVDRKAVDIDFDVWLLNEEEMRAISAKSLILSKFINRPINSINRTNNSINRTINGQKEKEREKENENETYTRTCAKAQVAPPSLDEIKEFCKVNNFSFDAERFYRYNQAREWKIGNTPIANWQELARSWQANEPKQDTPLQTHSYTEEQLNGLIDDISAVEF